MRFCTKKHHYETPRPHTEDNLAFLIINSEFCSIKTESMKTGMALLIALSVLASNICFGNNNIRFRHLNSKNGLSDNSVTALYQDKRGFIWIGTRNGLNLYNGQNIRVYKFDKHNQTGLADNTIKKITGGGENILYIQTDYGISSLDIAHDVFVPVINRPVGGIYYQGNSLYYSINDSIFRHNPTSGHSSLIYKLPAGNGTITYLHGDKDSLMIGCTDGLYLYTSDSLKTLVPEIHVIDIYEDSQETCWISSYDRKGLFSLDRNGHVRQFVHSASDSRSLSHNETHCCVEDDNGDIWVGTFNGLNRFDRETEEFTAFYHYGSGNSLTESSVWSLMKDKYGTIWAGTYYGGVNYFSPARPEIIKYDAGNSGKDNLSSPIVGQITEDRHGNIWICTEGGGLCRLDDRSGKFSRYIHLSGRNSISNDHVKCVFYDDRRNDVWCGTHHGGLNRLDLDTGKFTVYNTANSSLPSDIVMSIISYGNRLVVGTLHGIILLDPDTGEMTFPLKKAKGITSPDYIYSMTLDSSMNLWIICNTGSRVCRFNMITEDFIEYPELTVDKNGYTRKSVNSIYEDSFGNIWLCTNGYGLDLLTRGRHENIDRKNNGLGSDVIYEIREISPGKYIVSTDDGITIFRFDDKKGTNYRRNGFLPLSSISEHSLYVTEDGDIFLGGLDGMISFREEYLQDDRNTEYGIYPYALLVNGEEIHPGNRGILDEDISMTETVGLRYGQATFSIRYTVTDYLEAKAPELEYNLDGYSRDWLPLNNDGTVSFSKLKPGKYTLLVRSVGKNGQTCNGHSLGIRISPPLYLSGWAFLFYLLAISGVAVVTIRSHNNKIRMEAQIDYEKKHAESIENMNRDKLQFFTDISHEFRTPVNVITGQIRILMDKYNANTYLHTALSRVVRSCTQLEDLIDELLEFRKLDNGALKINVSNEDFVGYVNSIYLQYQQIAKSKELKFTFNKSHNRIMMWFDKRQIYKVINNLLSNAFKYVNENGSITVSVHKANGEVLLEVTNTGSYISPEEADKIFDKFYQTENSGKGTGIGLHLAKGIVEKHHGRIEVYSSKEDNETTFCVHLPIGEDAFAENEKISTENHVSQDEMTTHTADDTTTADIGEIAIADPVKKYKILIIEDDVHMREMLIDLLAPFYNITATLDGNNGYRIASEEQPNLILSDIQMPGKDGIELCRELKGAPSTARIPIILLSSDDKKEKILEAFQAGADDFVKKPFDVNILIAKCHNFIRNRVTSPQEVFIAREKHALATSIAEQKFLDRAKKTVMDNIGDSSLDAGKLASGIGVSRTKLFSRLKAISGITPKEFIMNIRLEEAAAMMAGQPELNITEIGDRLGFNSLKYFRQCFKEKYGIAPSEFRDKLLHKS